MQASEITLAIDRHEAAKALGEPAIQGQFASGTSVPYSLVRKWIQKREKYTKLAARETREKLSSTKQGWFRQSGP